MLPMMTMFVSRYFWSLEFFSAFSFSKWPEMNDVSKSLVANQHGIYDHIVGKCHLTA